MKALLTSLQLLITQPAPPRSFLGGGPEKARHLSQKGIDLDLYGL